MARGRVRLGSRNRQLVRGTSPSKIDADAVRRWWLLLPSGEKSRRLHFHDSLLVQRLYCGSSILCYSGLKCHMMGVHGHDDVRKSSGADAFAMECKIGSDGELRPTEWPALLIPAPNSWVEYVQRVLRIVELAIYDAHLEAVSSAAAVLPTPLPEPEVQGNWVASSKKSARRNHRKCPASPSGVIGAGEGADASAPDALSECAHAQDEVDASISCGRPDEGNHSSRELATRSMTEVGEASAPDAEVQVVEQASGDVVASSSSYGRQDVDDPACGELAAAVGPEVFDISTPLSQCTLLADFPEPLDEAALGGGEGEEVLDPLPIPPTDDVEGAALGAPASVPCCEGDATHSGWWSAWVPRHMPGSTRQLELALVEHPGIAVPRCWTGPVPPNMCFTGVRAVVKHTFLDIVFASSSDPIAAGPRDARSRSVP
mmetsp:Transcript_9731/g.30180  ORF Transcript_9731/g.30180 Transcript_9731/m.30180 type:complete len:430 (+) Transcript_9731:97-1386(+)